ncbi:copper resistance D family protein [Tunturiibacter gelidoferens]|uniref:CopD family protein n=1 Tax=Tunturiibacter gelidiferens TaxID=3069689 RepID=A0AAU7Z255_9BACT
MIWFLRDIDLLSVLARAATLAFEALLLGGVAFLLAVVRPARASGTVEDLCRRGIRMAALAFVVGQLALITFSGAILMSGSDLTFKDVTTTGFFRADFFAILFAIGLWSCARFKSNKATVALFPLSLLLLAATVSTSHAAARIDHRVLLAILTAAHHLGTAVWIGAMAYLLISLGRVEDSNEARQLTQRYSRMALIGAATLVLAGVGMAWFYVGSWSGMYTTAYGIMLVAKIFLLLAMITLGAGNWFLVRRLACDPEPLLVRLRRVVEAEVCLGFLAVLTAASLTAQAPAIDVNAQDRLTSHEIYVRLHPETPRMSSPPLTALAAPSSLAEAVQDSQFVATVGSDDIDRAWSEYNHHWAGLIVLIAGLLALLSRYRTMRWARFWPLTFAGLAVFILLRADPENWPLGPRPFWQSFAAPDVLQHRVGALLIVVFAAFECAVQAGKLKARWASYVFPAMCALGAALLLTHEHSAKDVKESMLAELSHTPVALLGITAGCSRWLDLRLPRSRMASIASYLWPVCLALVGIVLLNYRELP